VEAHHIDHIYNNLAYLANGSLPGMTRLIMIISGSRLNTLESRQNPFAPYRGLMMRHLFSWHRLVLLPVRIPPVYFKPLGIIDAGKFTNNLDSFLETRQGLLSVVLSTTDAAATRQTWVDAGIEPDAVKDLSRLLEPDVELKFQNVMLDPKVTADVPMFACSHLTADQMRQPGWTEHPNGAVGIKTVTAVTNEPASVIEPMSRIFGSG